MAKLSAFRVDSRAIKQGEWILVDPDQFDDLEILTRGLTDQYFDAQASRQRRAAVGLAGDTSKLPVAIRRSINVECLIEHVLLDVRNLKDDDGAEVTIDQFRELLRDPDYADLVVACIKAATAVGQRKAEDVVDAAGNSGASSAGS